MADPRRVMNLTVMSVRDKDLQSISLSDNLLQFIKHGDFGPLYDRDGEILRDNIQEILIFLDEDGGMHRISNRIILSTLIWIYIEHNDLYVDNDYDSKNPLYTPDEIMSRYILDVFRLRRSSQRLSGLVGFLRWIIEDFDQIMSRDNSNQIEQYLNRNQHLEPLDRAYETIGVDETRDEDDKIKELHRVNRPLFIRAVNDEIESRLKDNLEYLKNIRIDRSKSLIKSAIKNT